MTNSRQENISFILTSEPSRNGLFLPCFFNSPDFHFCSESAVEIVRTPDRDEEDLIPLLQSMTRAEKTPVGLKIDVPLNRYDFLRHPLFETLHSLYLTKARHLPDLSFLDRMDSLCVLYIEDAPNISDLKPLIRLLERQEDRYRAAESVEERLHLKVLKYLGICGACISDLSGFSHLTRSLSEVNFRYNQIQDIAPFAHLFGSRTNLSHNKIRTGFAELFHHVYPVEINLRHNQIDDEEVGRTLNMNPKKQFIHLFLHHNRITDYTVLRNRGISRTDITREEFEGTP